jgi:RND family efflux transporter MFP subunit
VLLRLDARAAEQNAAASDAQVQAARASLDLASKDFDRQKQLHADHFISKAALERAESEFKATQAQVNAQLAQSGAARTQSGFYVVKAPFAGVVSEVPVQLGDLAMPGRPLLSLYDPAALRVTAAVPQTVAAQVTAQTAARTSSQVASQKSAQLPGQKSDPTAATQLLQIELPGLTGGNPKIKPTKVQLLPIVDAATHTVQVRADLPAGLSGVTPGMFARLWLPMANKQGASSGTPISVAAGAIVRRAELTGLYVLDPAGKPVLRQVRLGRDDGDQVEVLSGLMPGEQVVSDPQAAARVH